MGCWNGTCGVSQMAILFGDPVVGFLLAANLDDSWDQNGHCYSDAYWGPYSLHIEGSYNDYGAIEDVDEDDWNYLFTLNRLKNEIIEKDVGENEYHDIEIKRDDLSWDYISRAMHENRLERPVSDVWASLYPNRKTQPIGLMMVHKNIFDAIVANGVDDLFGKKITVKSLMKDGKELIAALRKIQDELKDETTEEYNLARTKLRLGIEYILPERSWDKRNKFIGLVRHTEATSYKIGRTYMQYLTEIVEQGATDEELEPIIKKLAEFYIFDIAFSCLRKTWMPQAGAGSQHDEYDLIRCVNNATRKIISDRKSRWDE